MKRAPEETSETRIAEVDDSTEHGRSMRRMAWNLRWLDRHDHWWYRTRVRDRRSS